MLKTLAKGAYRLQFIWPLTTPVLVSSVKGAGHANVGLSECDKPIRGMVNDAQHYACDICQGHNMGETSVRYIINAVLVALAKGTYHLQLYQAFNSPCACDICQGCGTWKDGLIGLRQT